MNLTAFSPKLGVMALVIGGVGGALADEMPERFAPITHGVEGLTADLGVGLWGWPMVVDRNGDGHLDLTLVAGAMPKGTFYYENTGRVDEKTGGPLFRRTHSDR